MNNDTLSVKEFAAAASVSIQTIYKQLYQGGRLEPFAVTVKGKKRIKKEALEEFYDIQLDSDGLADSKPNSLNSKPESKPNSLNSKPESKPDSTNMEMAIKLLQNQLEIKDKQIEELTKNLHEAYKEIADMAKQAHYITAADKTEKIMQQQTKEEIIEPAAAAESQAMENKDTMENKDIMEKKPKKKWFQFWK